MQMRINPLMESEVMDQALVAYEKVRADRIKSQLQLRPTANLLFNMLRSGLLDNVFS